MKDELNYTENEQLSMIQYNLTLSMLLNILCSAIEDIQIFIHIPAASKSGILSHHK